ncbi:MAG: hypothetical protein IPJ94_10055 [Chloroflexi bacterium]|nr:hypothetical protein [Chloroflexota bacterium]
MLAEARKRPSLRQTPLHHLTPHAPLPFPDAQFDAVTFCSVLFCCPTQPPCWQKRGAFAAKRPSHRPHPHWQQGHTQASCARLAGTRPTGAFFCGGK